MQGAPTTITILASELREGDFIVDEGVVWLIKSVIQRNRPPVVVAYLRENSRLLTLDERLVVHLEDYGEEE